MERGEQVGRGGEVKRTGRKEEGGSRLEIYLAVENSGGRPATRSGQHGKFHR